MRITHVKRFFSFPFNVTVTWSRNGFAFNGDLMQMFSFFEYITWKELMNAVLLRL